MGYAQLMVEQLAARREISFNEMRRMVLTYSEPFTIYTEKLLGANMVRDMYSVPGPSGGALYNYSARGYMVLYDVSKVGYRTIVLKNVTKIKKNNISYYVK
jgi:hypothetical protein